jgi:hypothetical protein
MSAKPRLAIAAAMVAMAVAPRATAVDAPVMIGARVRVHAPGMSREPIVGTVVGSDETALLIGRPKGGLLKLYWPFGQGKQTLVVPRTAVTRFERSVRPSRKHVGAAIGAAIGATIGIVIFEKNREGEVEGQGGAMFMGVVALPFGLLGWAIAPGDRWADADPPKVKVAFRAVRRGAGVGLSLSF